MRAFANSRQTQIALVIAVALVAIVIPTCRMVGCTMQGGYMGFLHPGDGLGIFGTCGGEFTTTDAPSGVVPPGSETLVLSLLTSVAVAAAFVVSPGDAGRAVLVRATPPPPPEHPRGERFRV